MDITNISDSWQEILDFARNEYNLTETSYNSWLKPMSPKSIENNTLYVTIPEENEKVLSYIKGKYTEPIQIGVKELMGILFDVVFIVDREEPDDPGQYRSDEIAQDDYSDLSLNTNYTFDTFVVGNNNRFAHSASLAVAESPGEVYNPLFLYGGVGLGKTHLMQSIAQYIKQVNPSAVVRYVSSENFTNELIEAIRNNRQNNNQNAITRFREKYRNVDALLIDDIQFIIGKDATQEEFFHTFNALHTANKQIVISSDKPPKDIQLLEDRIRTRLEWGLLADIGAPDYETRMAILRTKCDVGNFKLSDEVMDYIATNITSNIRELEGCYNRLRAYAKIEECNEITMDIAEKELSSIISSDDSRIITPDYIMDVVCEHYHLTKESILSDKRTKDLAKARQIIMYLCHYMTNLSLKSIGEILGRDHSTVSHGVNSIEEDMQTDVTLKNNVDILRKKINPS